MTTASNKPLTNILRVAALELFELATLCLFVTAIMIWAAYFRGNL